MKLVDVCSLTGLDVTLRPVSLSVIARARCRVHRDGSVKDWPIGQSITAVLTAEQVETTYPAAGKVQGEGRQ